MKGQITEIKKESRMSATKRSTVVYPHNLFDNIIRRVSLKAIDLINKELEDVYERGLCPDTCGCYLRRTHGLPCACQLRFYITYEQSIPLEQIDAYWQKLDVEFSSMVNAETSDDDDDDDPPAPDTTDISAPPVVPKEKKDKKGVGARIPSAWEWAMKLVGKKKAPSGKGRGRVAGIIATQGSAMSISQGQGTSMSISQGRRPSTTTSDSSPDTPTSVPHRPSSSVLGPRQQKRMSKTLPIKGTVFEDQFAPFILRYIDRVTNVVGDGNCGFRAVAQAIYGSQEEWVRVRHELITELRHRSYLYETLLQGQTTVNELERRLSHWNGWCDRQHWMEMPECGWLIATRYNVMVVTFENLSGMTCLPAFVEPTAGPTSQTVVLGNVDRNRHWILLHMKMWRTLEHPVPPVQLHWERDHHPSASGLLDPDLIERIRRYNIEFNNDGPRRAQVIASYRNN